MMITRAGPPGRCRTRPGHGLHLSPLHPSGRRRPAGRPADEPGQIIRTWTQRLGSLQLPLRAWMTVAILALANWLADAAVLAVSIQATVATVPWHDLLLVYASGVAAQSLNITPGGLGSPRSR